MLRQFMVLLPHFAHLAQHSVHSTPAPPISCAPLTSCSLLTTLRRFIMPSTVQMAPPIYEAPPTLLRLYMKLVPHFLDFSQSSSHISFCVLDVLLTSPPLLILLRPFLVLLSHLTHISQTLRPFLVLLQHFTYISQHSAHF